MKIKKGDQVKVTTGKNKGVVGAVLQVFSKSNRVIVEGVNVKKRAVKRTESNEDNFVFIQHSIDASNVKLVQDTDISAKDESKKAKKSSVKKTKKSESK